MPLRGLLFKKLDKLRKDRRKHEEISFKQDAIKEAASLKQLRKTRIKTEGRSLLQKQIAEEKARIKAARGPTKIGRIEGFLKKQAVKGLTVAQKEAIKRAKRVRAGKPVFGKGSKKRRTRKKKRKKRS